MLLNSLTPQRDDWAGAAAGNKSTRLIMAMISRCRRIHKISKTKKPVDKFFGA